MQIFHDVELDTYCVSESMKGRKKYHLVVRKLAFGTITNVVSAGKCLEVDKQPNARDLNIA